MNIFLYQKNILKKISDFFIKNRKEYLKNIISNKYYLSTWQAGLGRDYVEKIIFNKKNWKGILIKKFKHKLFDYFLKQYIHNNKKIKFKNYKYLCISWAFRDDFSADGEFYDRYTKTKSRSCPNSIWILLVDKKEMPNKYDENILLISNDYSLKYFLSNIFNDLKRKFINQSEYKSINTTSTNYKKYKVIKDAINMVIQKNPINIVFTPYEAHTYQVGFFSYINNNFENIKTIGYIHSSLPALPTEYCFREGSPKILLTHGLSQKKILTNLLNWDKKKIFNINSLRYKFNNSLERDCVYLPYFLENENLILKEFETLAVNNKELINFSKLLLRNHPAMKKSLIHNEFIKELKNLINKIKKQSIKNTQNKGYPVVIGASAVIIELLELGYDVFHITPKPLFDVYSPLIWDDIKVNKLSPNTFIYKIHTKNKLIKRDAKDVKLHDIFTKLS